LPRVAAAEELRTISARLHTPSFAKMRRMCVDTVQGLMSSEVAMAQLVADPRCPPLLYVRNQKLAINF
jgi:hypothetical protein